MVLVIFPRNEIFDSIVDFHLVGMDRPLLMYIHIDPSNKVSIDVVHALMRSLSLSQIRSSDRTAHSQLANL